MAFITWDPDPILFQIPYLHFSLRTYGLLFALGFFAGYLLMRRSLGRHLQKLKTSDPKEVATQLTDRLVWLSVVGCVIGARLGHVLFYDRQYYQQFPEKIVAVWEGGLASHGGAVGVLLGFILFWYVSREKLQLSFLDLFDLFVPPVAITCVFIRLGNFFNQEILGLETDLPWAILFKHPADGTIPTPRHPVQLYEALAYLGTYFFLVSLKKARTGLKTGLFFMLVFGSRFVLEFWKSSQSGVFDQGLLQTGQLLSLPFIIAGGLLVIFSFTKSSHEQQRELS